MTEQSGNKTETQKSGDVHEAFVNIARVPTRILTAGKWIEDSLDDVKEIAICITGNPGLVGFYEEFASELHKCLPHKMPVWVIGHKGHDEPPPTSLREVPQLKGNEELFDLKSQIAHKVEFIERYVPAHAKIHLIGHSIGCWMILQMLRDPKARQRIIKCYMLFPTIERMIESPNGWIFTKIVLPLYSVFGFFITLFNEFPVAWRLFFINIYLWVASIPRMVNKTALNYTRTSVVEKVIFLAEDEMARVRGLEREVLRSCADMLIFYYGTTDGWVPVSYYEQLSSQYPDMDVILDDKTIDHAFVLRYSAPMAKIVSKMIDKNSNLS